MPERPGVVPYAAGASLAAVALIYVFGPTFTLDNDAGSSRKRTIVGLRNQANDCFINSVLQALAGLPDLRTYLIRETHRRRIENPNVYTHLVQPQDGQALPEWKLQGLQEGLVSQGLKVMLDALNERPIARKSVSPHQFVRVLEVAFKQRISRQQQDAQEFLQIVAERLKDEYHAGQRARSHARQLGLTASTEVLTKAESSQAEESEPAGDDANPQSATEGTKAAKTTSADQGSPVTTVGSTSSLQVPLEVEAGFPMEGQYESHIECQTCRYRTKPREEKFCSITLAVPQVSSTSLSACFDGIFKTEYIDDFKCEMCRLVQHKENLEHELSRSTSESFKAATRQKIEKLKKVMETDPENVPDDIELGDIRYAPKRKIAKTTRMSVFPKILAVHLSRSIYGGAVTQKNTAKVSFPEQLPMGGLTDQHKYKLLGMVSHKGGHNSGHYEAFRRQNTPAPYHHTNTFQKSEVYSKTPTPTATPEISALQNASPAISTPDLLSPSSGASSSAISVDSLPPPPRSVPGAHALPLRSSPTKDSDTSSLRSVAASTKSALSRLTSPSKSGDTPSGNLSSASDVTVSKEKPKHSLPKRYKRQKNDKWWRVSDEKVREAKTGEVLGMQKEVYLLFYELDREAGA